MKSFFLAPMVVALRIPRLIGEAQQAMLGRATTRPEAERMMTEKLAAIREGVSESALEAFRSSTESGLKAMRGDLLGATQHMSTLPLRMGRAALRPAQDKVQANIRRLSKP